METETVPTRTYQVLPESASQTSLLEVLAKLKTVSQKILIRGIEIMKKLQFEDDEIFDDIEYGADMEKSEIVDKCRDYSLELTADAKVVIGEVDRFLTRKSDKTYEVSEDPNLFLVAVWNGDAYGVFELEALDVLLSTLKDNLKHLSSEENFILYCTARLNNEKHVEDTK